MTHHVVHCSKTFRSAPCFDIAAARGPYRQKSATQGALIDLAIFPFIALFELRFTINSSSATEKLSTT